MKLTKISGIVLLATAVLLAVLFICMLNISKIDADENVENPGEALGLAVMLLLALPASFLWPVTAAILLTFGLLFILLKNVERLRTALKTGMIFTIIFGILCAISFYFAWGVFNLIAPSLTPVSIVALVLLVACLVLQIVTRKKLPSQEIQNADSTQPDQE